MAGAQVYKVLRDGDVLSLGVVKGEGGEATWAGRVAQRLSEATGDW